MKTTIAVATLFAFWTFRALAGEVPAKTFFNGNDIYQWCQHDKAMVRAYVGGMYDEVAHGAAAIDDMRHHGAMPKNDIEVDFALDRVAGFCMPEHVALEQLTDVFCAYLRDKPADRNGLPSIMLNNALKQAWRCSAK